MRLWGWGSHGIRAIIRGDTKECSISPSRAHSLSPVLQPTRAAPRHVRTQWEGGHLQPRKRVPTRNWLHWRSDVGLPASRTVRHKLVFKPPTLSVYGILFWHPEQTRTVHRALSIFQVTFLSQSPGGHPVFRVLSALRFHHFLWCVVQWFHHELPTIAIQFFGSLETTHPELYLSRSFTAFRPVHPQHFSPFLRKRNPTSSAHCNHH